MMNSRGSGFFDFAFTTLTVGNLIVGLLFFATPSTAMGVLSMSLSVLLVVDMIMILAVPRLRAEEGWVGLASVIWAAVIGLWSVLSNKTVRWGKKEEEERLTGRQETKRSLREWCAVFTATFFMVIFVVIVVFLTATIAIRARDATLEVPGVRYYVDGDKYQVHLDCVGNNTYDSKGNKKPIILLEGAEEPVEYNFVTWVENAYKNGTIDKYCYWDRPGLAFSDDCPSPHSAGMSADALSEALAIAGETGPYVLVSGGIGSIYSRIFSSRHVREVTGIMLIDPLHEDLLYQVGAPGRGFMLWARGIISPLGLRRLFGAIIKGRTREDRVYGRSAYQSGKYIKAKLQENLVANSLTKSEVVSARNIQQPKVPLVVISSGDHVRKDKVWAGKQEDLTKITDNLIAWETVEKAPHEVWTTTEGRTTLEKRLKQLYGNSEKLLSSDF